MFKRFLNWLRGPDLNDCNIEVKVKYKSGNQGYDAICWYKVYGYWRIEGTFCWKSLGVIHHESSYGLMSKLTDHSRIAHLLKAKQRAKKVLENDPVTSNYMKFHVSELNFKGGGESW